MATRSALAALILCLAPLAGAANPEDAARLAREGFFALEARPFHSEALRDAARNIDLAARMSPDHAWVLVARSRAVLEAGYMKGDRSRLASYEADSVRVAGELARRALEAGPREPMAHIQVARIQIITEDHRGAWDTVNRAHALDPQGFYPWYYRGVIALRMKDPKRASEAFDAAEARASMPYQKEWAVGRRIDIARQQGDAAAEERLHKQLIALKPSEPHPYGNYGIFLKRQKRYDEAIEYFGKALAISPYRQAEEQLKQTLLLRDGAKRQ